MDLTEGLGGTRSKYTLFEHAESVLHEYDANIYPR